MNTKKRGKGKQCIGRKSCNRKGQWGQLNLRKSRKSSFHVDLSCLDSALDTHHPAQGIWIRDFEMKLEGGLQEIHDGTSAGRTAKGRVVIKIS